MQRQQRKLVRVRVDFSSSSEAEEFTSHGYTEDITTNGCQIESTTIVPPGRYLTVRFYLPNSTEMVRVELARVRWVEARHFGVEFIALQGESRTALDRLAGPTQERISTDQAPMLAGLSNSILVVEDDPDQMLLYSTVLHKAGHKVLQAAGSIEAMKVCFAVPKIDLAIVDVMLKPPELRVQSSTDRFHRVNGPQLVRDLLAVRKQLRILFISAFSPAELRNHGLLLGSFPFLQKPLSKEQFLETIGMVLAAPAVAWTPPSE